MKRTFLLVFLIASILFVHSYALANAAEPPGLTVIVSNPPEGLVLRIKLNSEDIVELTPDIRFWEGQYRFYYHSMPGIKNKIKNAELSAEWGDGTLTLPIPGEYFGYNNQVTLNLKANELIQGQNQLRAPLLAAMRILLTLVIEGVILYAFGYRTKKSVLLFFLVNIITQGLLNIAFIGARGYWQILFVLAEVLIFTVESLLYRRFLSEYSNRRAIIYALTANAASLVLGGWMISSLPV